jgi:hypothetical protein
VGSWFNLLTQNSSAFSNKTQPCVIIGTEFRADPFDIPVFPATLIEKTETF